MGNVPLQITLPTVFDPVFKVRDFGKGLSQEDIFAIYSSYGESTKENSNTQIGTLGMGSKSGFAYSSSFTITSYNGGYKKIYEAFIDESNLGMVALVHQELSDAPTGIEITISVHKNDINAFIERATKFFMWFTPQPVFLGYDLKSKIEEIKKQKHILLDNADCVLYSEPRYYYNNTTGPSVHVQMGNICYGLHDNSPFDLGWLPNNHYLVIKVDLGDVSFTTSRESLEMTPLTINTLTKKLSKIRPALASEWQSEIDKQSTPFQALMHYQGMTHFQRSVIENLTWRGEKLNKTLSGKVSFMEYSSYNKKWKSYGISYDKELYGKYAIIVNDGGFPTTQTKSRLMLAHATLVAQKYEYIRFAKGTVADSIELLNSREAVGLHFIKLSDIAASAVKNASKAFKSKEKVFKWNNGREFPYSSNWTSVDLPDDKIIFVDIEKFKPVKYSFSNLQNIVSYLKELGEDITIYGIKPGGKTLPNHQRLEDFLKEKGKEIVLSDSYYQTKYKMFAANSVNNGHLSMLAEHRNVVALADTIECPDFKNIVEYKRPTYNRNEYSAEQRLLDFISTFVGERYETEIENIKKKASVITDAFNEQCRLCEQKYPLLSHGIIRSYDIDSKVAKHIIEYVNSLYQAEKLKAGV
jgi:hypothetical protein